MTDRRPPASMVDADPRRDEDGVRWLALTLAEAARVLLAGIVRRYPEARTKAKCPHCGHRG